MPPIAGDPHGADGTDGAGAEGAIGSNVAKGSNVATGPHGSRAAATAAAGGERPPAAMTSSVAGAAATGGGPPAAPTFARRLNLFDATMIVISGIVGSGIFINPHVVAEAVHTPALIVGVWVAGGGIALLGAFVFAELSTVMPRVGGQYAFFREAFHPLVAFLHGWSLLLIVQSAATAAVAVAFAQYLAKLAGLPQPLVAWMAAAILLLLAGFHALGVRPGALVINVITFSKVLALAALIAGVLVFAHSAGWLHAAPDASPAAHGLPLLSAFFAGLVPAMFSYGGWQTVNYIAEEVREPERNLPRAILIGVSCVILLYVGANIAYLNVLTPAVLAASKTPAADAATLVLGSLGGRVISTLIVVSTFGFLNHALLTAPRVYYAMAADGLFFRGLARLSPRFQVPVAAILLQAGLAAAFALSRSYERLLAYTVFADWIFFALTGAALLVFRRKLPQAPRPFPTPGYPWVPIVFSLVGVGIVINLFFTEAHDAWLGSAVLAAGVPVYYYWRAVGRRRAAAGRAAT
jgi:APA family basic amino acid/polyamine antiporter